MTTNTTIKKFGQVSYQMMVHANIWNSWMTGQKMYSKQVWRLTKDGLSNMLLIDNTTLTKLSQSIFSIGLTRILHTYMLATSWHGRKV